MTNIVCAFCNAPWTSEMIIQLDYISNGCDSCNFGRYAEISLEIQCENCQRIIYKKDGIKVE